MRMRILMSDYCETEILESDNDFPTTPPCKQLWSVPQFLLERVIHVQ